jgi:hypothetical protein
MKWKFVCLVAGLSALGVAACNRQSAAPSSPTTTPPASAEANADGSLLKVDAPTLQSPADGARLDQSSAGITLVVNNVTPRFGSGDITYRFQVFNPNNQIVADGQGILPGAGGITSYTIPTTVSLEGDQTHTWWARLEYLGETGPWSPRWSFIPPTNEGYIRGAELYDPLANGKSVAQSCGGCGVVGPHQFIPGVGLRFFSQLTHVFYTLPQTLMEGEFSLIVSDMDGNTDGGKTKLFAMGQGFDDIVTNDRRMTVEKRGDPAGVVAWRFITHSDQIDTEGHEREFVSFSRSQIYFWQATWRNNFFNVLIREGGPDGRTIYSKGKHFQGRAYDPNPHVLYLGSHVGRSGPEGASVDNVTYRQVWVSANPRPAFANK